MKQNLQEAIRLHEQITAARFYTERGRAALMDVIAAALFLSDEDKAEIVAAGQTQYVHLQEVRNALLLLMGTQHNECRAAVLHARAETLAEMGNLPYRDKSGWLIYVHKAMDSHSEREQFDAACFLAAIGQRQEAYDKFASLATRGDLTANWMALGLARLMSDEGHEMQRISALTHLYDQGVIDYLPEALEARREQLAAGGYEAQAGYDFGGNKIGF